MNRMMSKGFQLERRRPEETDLTVTEVIPEKINLIRSSGTLRLERTDGDIALTVYRGLDASIAVFIVSNGDEDYLFEQELYIGDSAVGTKLAGYMDGNSAVFCCILTDAEVNAIEKGSLFRIDYEPESLNANYHYHNSPYASVRRGTGRNGIINREGEYVIEPVYSVIGRPDMDSFHMDTPNPFLCESEGKLTVPDGETLAVIVEHMQ